jgi:hypothetical protein
MREIGCASERRASVPRVAAADVALLCGVVMLDNERWSLYGAQRSQLVATGGKWEGAENGSDKRKPLPSVATSCLSRSMVSRASAVSCHPLREVPSLRGSCSMVFGTAGNSKHLQTPHRVANAGRSTGDRFWGQMRAGRARAVGVDSRGCSRTGAGSAAGPRGVVCICFISSSIFSWPRLAPSTSTAAARRRSRRKATPKR